MIRAKLPTELNGQSLGPTLKAFATTLRQRPPSREGLVQTIPTLTSLGPKFNLGLRENAISDQ